jgi:hypothetical protein
MSRGDKVDGNRVARIWETETGGLLGTLPADMLQVRVAEARTGRPELTRDLPNKFGLWGVISTERAIAAHEFHGDQTPGQPVFSPDGQRIAVPDGGVCVLDCGPSARTGPKDLWLGRPGILACAFPNATSGCTARA